MNRPSVLVAVSVRNGERFLGEALTSILAQRGVDFRVVVYDNASTDASVAIARDLGVDVVANPDGWNFFHSMNRAVAEHEATYLAPFACDDVMLPGNLRAKVRALEVSDAAIVHGGVELIDEHGATVGTAGAVDAVDDVIQAPAAFPHLVPLNTMLLPSVLVRTDALRAIGGFDPRSILCGDWLCWIRLGLRYAVASVRDPLVRYRQHADAGSVRGIEDGRFAEHDAGTITEAYADPALPEAWRDQQRVALAAKMLHTAHLTDRAGARRWSSAPGVAAYGIAGLALLQAPKEPLLRTYHRELVEAADLAVPREGWRVLSRLETPASAAELVGTLRRLRESALGRSFVVAVDPSLLDAAVAALTAELNDADDVPIDLVGAPDDAPLFHNADVYLGDGKARLAAAERAGLPALPFTLPSPYERPRDPERFELLPAASVTPAAPGVAA